MRTNTRQITDGAMFIAIFAMLLLFNRYTGTVFEELIVFVLPLPMTAYAVKYGFKSSVPVAIAMALMSAITGNFTSIFYRFTQALIGLVFGTCLHKKIDTSKTLFRVIIMSVIANVINIVLLVRLFGYNLRTEAAEMQQLFLTNIQASGLQMPTELLTTTYFVRMMGISVVLTGILQGYATYLIGLMVLKRLRFQVEKPKPIYYFYPPVISAWICLALFGGYCYSLLSNMAEPYASILQILGTCATIYLCFFGFLFIMLFFRVRLYRLNAILRAVLSVLLTFMFSQLAMMLGFMYIAGYRHYDLMDRLEKMQKQMPKTRY